MENLPEWTLIDLRPLRKTVFYRRKFKLEPLVLELFKNYDFYIIPKTENEPPPNYVLRN